MFARIFASIFAALMAFLNFFTPLLGSYSFAVDTSVQGEVLANPVSNINVWNMKSSGFDTAQANDDNNIFDFVEYVQLMQCSGGSVQRDLFVNPLDTSVLDDYDFAPLLANCRGILSLGAKPHLKLGSVPLKYSAGSSSEQAFGTNIYPPDDYNIYYNYISALAKALVDEFGAEEVLTWRFGVMTEFENSNWFMARSGKPEDSAVEYCKLYDFTVAALQDTVGEAVFVGAHAMAVTEGLWDEAVFIRHCANGINCKTGRVGSRLCFLSASFYDSKPGVYTAGMTLPETIDYLRSTAESVGLNSLIYGVDEGRLLCGAASGTVGDELVTRICGYTYQAAYDARIIKQMFDNGIDYFSSWGYLSGGIFKGNPTVSYHVAKNAARFAGCRSLKVTRTGKGLIPKAQVQSAAALDSDSGTVHIMAYNFKNSLDYRRNADIKITLNSPELEGKRVRITKYVIDDSCNYFDEWVEDRKALGIDDSCFSWSPDDPQIDSTTTLADARAREIYFNELYPKYTECSRLVPSETVIKADATIVLKDTLSPNGVIFYEIIPC